MIVAKAKALIRPLRTALSKDHDWFLRSVSGVVHVGANTGQERDVYHGHDLSVLWVEPIQSTFAELANYISDFPKQKAVQALVTDVDDEEYPFHISNNDGQSSSILDLKQHRELWPKVEYTSTVSLRSITLASLFEREQIDTGKYQALVLDTQGSELLVLQGSRPLLKYFEYIKTEVPDFESYEGCCQVEDVAAFMGDNGYEEVSRHRFARRAKCGSYFDIVYRRVA